MVDINVTKTNQNAEIEALSTGNGLLLYSLDELSISDRTTVDTGLSIEIPEGWYAEIFPHDVFVEQNYVIVHPGFSEGTHLVSFKVINTDPSSCSVISTETPIASLIFHETSDVTILQP